MGGTFANILLIAMILVCVVIFVQTLSSLILDLRLHKLCKNSQEQQNKVFETLEALRKLDEEDVFEENGMLDTMNYKNKLDYNSMNVSELKALAKSCGVKGYYRMKKEELINSIKSSN